MSQEDGETKDIDGTLFRVRMLDPLVASDLLVDIGQALGPALGAVLGPVLKAPDSGAAFGQLLDGVKGGGEDELAKDMIGDGLERAIVGLVDRLDKAKLRHLIATLETVTHVQKDGSEVALAKVSTVLFRGRLKTMFRWVGFALRVQYRDFF